MLALLAAEIKNLHKTHYLAVKSRSGIFPDNWEYIYEVQFVAPQKYNKVRVEFLKNSRGYFPMDNFATGGALPEGSLPRKDIDDRGIYDPFADDFFALAGRHGIKVILIAMYEMEGAEKEEGINVTSLQEWQALKRRFKNISFAKEGLNPAVLPV